MTNKRIYYYCNACRWPRGPICCARVPGLSFNVLSGQFCSFSLSRKSMCVYVCSFMFYYAFMGQVAWNKHDYDKDGHFRRAAQFSATFVTMMHNWCIQVILLLLGIHDVGTEKIYTGWHSSYFWTAHLFSAYFSPQSAPKPFSGRALHSTRSCIAGFRVWAPGKGKQEKERKDGRERGSGDGHPQFLKRGCVSVNEWTIPHFQLLKPFQRKYLRMEHMPYLLRS